MQLNILIDQLLKARWPNELSGPNVVEDRDVVITLGTKNSNGIPMTFAVGEVHVGSDQIRLIPEKRSYWVPDGDQQ